jgi:hypothetical protein
MVPFYTYLQGLNASNKDTNVACTERLYQNLVNGLKQHIHTYSTKTNTNLPQISEQYKITYIVQKNKDNCKRNEPENKYYKAQQCHQNKTQHAQKMYEITCY